MVLVCPVPVCPVDCVLCVAMLWVVVEQAETGVPVVVPDVVPDVVPPVVSVVAPVLVPEPVVLLDVVPEPVALLDVVPELVVLLDVVSEPVVLADVVPEPVVFADVVPEPEPVVQVVVSASVQAVGGAVQVVEAAFTPGTPEMSSTLFSVSIGR